MGFVTQIHGEIPMSNLNKIRLTEDHHIAKLDGYKKAAYGNLLGLRKVHDYWSSNNHYTFRRRVSSHAVAPTMSEIDFVNKVYEIASEDAKLEPFEAKFHAAFGPYCVYDPDVLLNNLEEYFENKAEFDLSDCDHDLLTMCFGSVTEELLSVKSKSDRPLTIEESLKELPAGTNSGLPYFTSRKWTDDMTNDYVNRAKSVIEGNHKVLYPYVLQNRLQPKGISECKVRAVWNPDKSELIASGTVTRPMQKLMQRLECYAGYNGPHALPPIFERWFNEYDLFVSLDFSKFDASISMQLTGMMMQVINDVFPGNEALLSALFIYYTQGPILAPTKVKEKKGVDIWHGIHGIPSGIGATFLTSLINRATMKFVMTSLDIPEDGYAHIANGDDTALAIKAEHASKFDLNKVSELYGKLGLIVNPDPRKQELSLKGVANEMSNEAYLTFLGRLYFESDSSGIMPMTRMATGIYFQERFIPEQDLIQKLKLGDVPNARDYVVAADCIGIIQKLENCRNHSQLDALVPFIATQCAGLLDINLWYSKHMDKIAKIVRTGRASSKLPLMTYKSVKALLKYHNSLISVGTIKTISEASFSDLPRYKDQPDMRSWKRTLEFITKKQEDIEIPIEDLEMLELVQNLLTDPVLEEAKPKKSAKKKAKKAKKIADETKMLHEHHDLSDKPYEEWPTDKLKDEEANLYAMMDNHSDNEFPEILNSVKIALEAINGILANRVDL